MIRKSSSNSIKGYSIDKQIHLLTHEITLKLANGYGTLCLNNPLSRTQKSLTNLNNYKIDKKMYNTMKPGNSYKKLPCRLSDHMMLPTIKSLLKDDSKFCFSVKIKNTKTIKKIQFKHQLDEKSKRNLLLPKTKTLLSKNINDNKDTMPELEENFNTDFDLFANKEANLDDIPDKNPSIMRSKEFRKFMIYLKEGNIDIVKEILSDSPCLINQIDLVAYL